MRSRIGSYVLAIVASYAPASLSPVLTLAEKTHVTKAIRGSVLDHVRHWLRPYVDRPQHARLMSRRAFHEAVERILASTESAPDVDAIYALLAFREFDTSWLGLRHMKAPTPLFSAARAAHAGVVRLFLEHRATPDGFQRSYVCHRFHRYECLVETTPLWAAVKESSQTSSAIHVVRMLMQARADPDACGEKEDVVHWGRARGGLDSEMYVLRRINFCLGFPLAGPQIVSPAGGFYDVTTIHVCPMLIITQYSEAPTTHVSYRSKSIRFPVLVS